MDYRRSEPQCKDPLNFDSSLDLIQAVGQARSLADMDIGTLAFIQRYGTCSLHGAVTDEVDVSSGVALAEDYIRCRFCGQMGVMKKCPVESVGPVGRE